MGTFWNIYRERDRYICMHIWAQETKTSARLPQEHCRTCIRMYACIYIYMYICIHMYKYVYMCIHVYTCAYICIHVYRYAYVCLHTYIYIYMNMYTFIYIHIHSNAPRIPPGPYLYTSRKGHK